MVNRPGYTFHRGVGAFGKEQFHELIALEDVGGHHEGRPSGSILQILRLEVRLGVGALLLEHRDQSPSYQRGVLL